MTEKGCDNCYYTYFDERAYPCSLCIRGIERTDQWQPSRKTRATISKMEQVDKDINVRSKTEPQTVCKMPYEDCEDCETHLKAQYGDCNKCKWYGDKQVCGRCRSRNLYVPKDEPQTEEYCGKCNHKGCDNCVADASNPYCVPSRYEPKTEPQNDLLVTEYPQDGEVNLIGRDKTKAVVMAYDVYKELTEPQTDCSWKKGE